MVSTRTREKVNILLVDDQPGKLLSYEAVLDQLGENLLKAGSAREALHRLLDTEVAVVLVDVCMPEFDGFDLVSMIREHPRYDKTAIILVSAVLMSDVDRLRGYERGAIDYMSVPIVPEILRAKVNAFVDLYRKTNELERMNEELERRVLERTQELETSNERLRASEERLSMAVAAGSVATWVWDVETDRIAGDERFAFFCDAAPVEAAQGTPLRRLLDAVVDEDRDDVADRIAQALEDGENCVIECRMRAADGEVHWIRAQGRIERSRSGRAIRLPGAMIDITEHLRMQEALRDADRRKDEFLAVLSHELRNPLASINNAVEVMRAEEIADPSLRWCRDLVYRQVGHLTRLVDDLLDVSRITQGKVKLRVTPVDLRELLQTAVDTSRTLLEERGHELLVEVPPEPVWVDGDAARLTQVITNLLSNASKYQDEGGRVQLTLERQRDDAVIRVKDDGIGITPEMLPHVFELFAQEEGTRGYAQGGLGIGLSLVKRLVGLHAGDVEARSGGRHRGSEFLVRLPCCDEPSDREPSIDASSPLSRRNDAHKILVVDDHRDAAESLAMLLKLAGFPVLTAHDGPSALGLAREQRPSVVLLDIGMPGMSGLEVCRHMRNDTSREALIVAMTGYGHEVDRQRSKEAGFDVHVVKPVDFGALLKLINARTETSTS